MGRIALWLSAIVFVAFSASGCQSILDPAPFRPSAYYASKVADCKKSDGTEDKSESCQQARVDKEKLNDTKNFIDLTNAQDGLRLLADAYADHRDTLMRQQLWFDIPAIGLGVAAVANGIFGGSTATTLGLGLGAGTLGAGSFYFAPRARVVAYNAAALSLDCSASVAVGMISAEASITILDGKFPGTTVAELLVQKLSEAYIVLVSTEGTASERESLIVARDAAQKASSDINDRKLLLKDAPAKLSIFGNAVVRATTGKIVGDVQNIKETLDLISKIPTSAAAPKSAADKLKTTELFSTRDKYTSKTSIPDLLAALILLTSNAKSQSALINAAWTIKNCELSAV